MSKTNYQKLIEAQIGMPIEQKILQCLQAGMSDTAIASSIGVPTATVTSWRRKYIVVSHELREPVAAGR